MYEVFQCEECKLIFSTLSNGINGLVSKHRDFNRQQNILAERLLGTGLDCVTRKEVVQSPL